MNLFFFIFILSRSRPLVQTVDRKRERNPEIQRIWNYHRHICTAIHPWGETWMHNFSSAVCVELPPAKGQLEDRRLKWLTKSHHPGTATCCLPQLPDYWYDRLTGPTIYYNLLFIYFSNSYFILLALYILPYPYPLIISLFFLFLPLPFYIFYFIPIFTYFYLLLSVIAA